MTKEPVCRNGGETAHKSFSALIMTRSESLCSMQEGPQHQTEGLLIAEHCEQCAHQPLYCITELLRATP